MRKITHILWPSQKSWTLRNFFHVGKYNPREPKFNLFLFFIWRKKNIFRNFAAFTKIDQGKYKKNNTFNHKIINWLDKMHQCALITTLMSTEPKLTVANIMYIPTCLIAYQQILILALDLGWTARSKQRIFKLHISPASSIY